MSNLSCTVKEEISERARLYHLQVLLKHLLSGAHRQVVHVCWCELRGINRRENCNPRVSRVDHRRSYLSGKSTFNPYFSSIKSHAPGVEDVAIVHGNNGNDRDLGLHCEMKRTFLER